MCLANKMANLVSYATAKALIIYKLEREMAMTAGAINNT
jgi:hypothetical protein